MQTTDQIREQKLAQIILDQAMQDPDSLGEALLKYSFVGEGRGCYSNFELRPSFREWSEGRDIFAERLIGHPDDYFGDFPLNEIEYEKERNRISSFLDPELDLAVIWFWEHDGHLIFKLGDVVLENTDIKKSYGWEFVS